MIFNKKLIAENLNLLTSAIKADSNKGRGWSRNPELYGIEKLRKLVLDLAVRGMLVPQDPEEGSAAELLNQIFKEKEKLVKKKNKKKPKYFDELLPEEEPFLIPSKWKWSRLGTICTKITDGSHNPPPDSGKGYPMLSSQNIYFGEIDFSSPSRYLNEKDFVSEDKRTVIKPFDVLLNIVGSIGRSAVVPLNAPKFALQRSVAVLSSSLDPYYLSMVLTSSLCSSYFATHAKGTAQKGIYLGKLSLMPLPIPPLAEQHRIVSKVEELMTLCNQLEEEEESIIQTHNSLLESVLRKLIKPTLDNKNWKNNWKTLQANFNTLFITENSIEQLKETILQLAVIGKLVPQNSNDEPVSKLLKKIQLEKDELLKNKKIRKPTIPSFNINQEDFFELPVGWEWVSLGMIGNIFNGNSINKNIKEEKYMNVVGYPYVATKDVGYGFESLKYNNGVSIPFNEPNFKKASKNSVLVCSEGGSAGKKCGITDRDICFGNKLYANELYGNINPNFILAFYLTPLFFNQFRHFMTGIIGGVSVSKFAQIQCPLPPIPEQEKIMSKVYELFSLCDQLKDSITSARNTQISLADSLVEKALR